MKFVREDYQKSKEKKNTIIGVVACLVLVAGMYFLFIKGSSAPGDGTLEPETSATSTGESETPVNDGETTDVKDLPALFARASQSVVLIKTYDVKDKLIGQGSGFFISNEGHLVSNRHVFGGATRAEIQNKKGTFEVVKVVAEAGKYDMVHFQVKMGKKKSLPLKLNKTTPKIGEKVLVIGNPMGLESTISDGIVSAVRELKPYGTVIQITSPISPGSSGSPVLNMKGEVIGVATFQMREGQNLNFAVPIARLDDLDKVDGNDLTSVNFKPNERVASMTNPFDKGMVMFNDKQYRGAINYFKKAVEENPENAEAFLYLGICYRETRATNSIDAFKSALAINPKYAEAYCHMGKAYNQLNMTAEAIEALKKALELDPNYDEALTGLGVSYGLTKRFQAAVNTLKKSLDITPSANAYYYLGYSYGQLKRFAKAIRAFETCLEIDPEHMNALLGLGTAFAAVENWRRGIKVLNKAVILEPENLEVHFILGFLHLGNDDIESALLEKAILEKNKKEKQYWHKLSAAIEDYKRYKKYKRGF